MRKLDGKLAVITGGTSGIGKATAVEFLKEGATVIITGRNQETIDETIKELGGNIHGIVSDAGKMTDIRALSRQIQAISDRVDVLFINAGYARYSIMETVNEAHFDEQFNVLVKGGYFTVQEIVPLMKSGGTVVLNTSVVTELGLPTWSIYSAAKSAVQSFNKTLANELIGRNIRVNAVSPGAITTDFLNKTGLDATQIKDFFEGILTSVPMKRAGTAEEIAKAVLFLASDDSSYMMGSEIYVDGGLVQV
ncbi:SDR family oxidoreductase [Mucilaginibacter terrae]|uniref:SDR family oxidoreductase n=1 Tax=Mucilaginibacter terrae TaxID=1955052 RepID=UPI003644B271